MEALHTVANARSARVFSSERCRQALLLLVERPRALTELAQALGISLSHAHYYIGRLTGLSLIGIVQGDLGGEPKRKRYRAVAFSFYVPAEFEAAPASTGLSRELARALEAQRSHDGVVYDVAHGRPRMRRVAARANRSGAERWHVLKLSAEDAEAFIRDYDRLVERYAGNESGKPEHLVHLGFARRIA